MYKIALRKPHTYYYKSFESVEEATSFIEENENLLLSFISEHNANLKEILSNIERYYEGKENLSDICLKTILFDTTNIYFYFAIEVIYLGTITYQTKLLINGDEYTGIDGDKEIGHIIVKYLLTTKKPIKSILIDTDGEGYVNYEVKSLNYPFTLEEAKEIVFPDNSTSDTTMWKFVSNQREDVGDALTATAEKKIHEGINELIKLKAEIQSLYYLSTQKK